MVERFNSVKVFNLSMIWLRSYCWHGDILHRQAQMLRQHPRDCHIGTARHLQVNYSSDYHLLCLKWILWVIFSPLKLSSLYKSSPSLNPVKIENCRYHVGCFRQ